MPDAESSLAEGKIVPRTGRVLRGLRAGLRLLGWGDGAILVALVLLVAGSVVASYKVSLVRDLRHVGHADEAGYALMGRSLAEGRGLQVNHVSFFFIPYPRSITRTEDHWPPFLGFACAPFLRWYGIQAWAAKLAPILIGSVGFPLAAAALGLAFSRRSLVALGTGALMLFHDELFTESLRMMSDIATAMWVAAFAAAVLGARTRPWLHVLAGAALALAFYSKGSMVLLLALWPVCAAVMSGPRVFLRRWWWIGVGVACLGIAPFCWSKWREYGHPLHSTQNYVSGYIGLVPWEQGTYSPYWGEGLPELRDRWTKHAAAYRQQVRENAEVLTDFALFRRPQKRGPTPWQAPVGKAAIAFSAFLLAVVPVSAAWRFGCRRAGWEETERARALAFPAGARGVCVLGILGLAQWAFVVFFWEGYPRLVVPLLPMVCAVGCAGLVWCGELPMLLALPRAWPRWRWGVVGLAAVAALGWGLAHREAFFRQHRRFVAARGFPYRDQAFYPVMGDWVSANLPNAVIMTRNPWELLFSCPPTTKAVNVPLADAWRVLAIARYYGVTHYLADGRRPAMAPWLRGQNPAFVRVPGAPGELYEIRWDLLLQPQAPANPGG